MFTPLLGPYHWKPWKLVLDEAVMLGVVEAGMVVPWAIATRTARMAAVIMVNECIAIC